MKYERLTDRQLAEMLIYTEGDSWDSDNIEAQCYIRLAELEDKIERGEIDYASDRDKEIARLIAENQRLREEAAEQKSIAEHEHATQMEWFRLACDYKAENAEVSKQAIKAFAERVKMAFYYEFDELIPSIMAEKIDELIEEIVEGKK